MYALTWKRRRGKGGDTNQLPIATLVQKHGAEEDVAVREMTLVQKRCHFLHHKEGETKIQHPKDSTDIQTYTDAQTCRHTLHLAWAQPKSAAM